ncbi:hypothetical protein JCM31598_26470 [Desulfonatronum parangueonense]
MVATHQGRRKDQGDDSAGLHRIFRNYSARVLSPAIEIEIEIGVGVGIGIGIEKMECPSPWLRFDTDPDPDPDAILGNSIRLRYGFWSRKPSRITR